MHDIQVRTAENGYAVMEYHIWRDPKDRKELAGQIVTGHK